MAPVILLAALIGACGSDDREIAPRERDAAAGAPNVIAISMDDASLDWFSEETMPETWERVAADGTNFTEAIVTTPLCCPARATYLTGQYGHNNGVVRNDYADLRQKGNVLPVWLQRAGYVTAHVGKFLNLYEKFVDDPAEPAPGWDIWESSVGQPDYYDYELSIDGERESFGSDEDELLTIELNRRAKELVSELAPRSEPYYLQLDHFAPHAGGTHELSECKKGQPEPAAEDYEEFADAELPMPPSYDEADVSDKPPYVQKTPRVDESKQKRLEREYRCSLASMRTADRGIGELLDEVAEGEDADRTVVIFWSDNGYMLGEHRLFGKGRPYTENIRVPIAIQGPDAVVPGAEPGSSDAAVANIDLAPTILDLASARPCDGARCRTPDGRSLVPLLRGSEPGWVRDRSLLFEKDRTPGVVGGTLRDPAGDPCSFRGVWTRAAAYIRTTEVKRGDSGQCVPSAIAELYLREPDPFQLESVHDNPAFADEVATLDAELQRLRSCAGTSPNEPNPCD